MRKLKKDPHLLKEYDLVIQEQLRDGVIEAASDLEAPEMDALTTCRIMLLLEEMLKRQS